MIYEKLELAKKGQQQVIKKTKETLLWNHYYNALREPKVNHGVIYPKKEALVKQLKDAGIKVEPLTIDVADYKRYMQQADYSSYKTKILPEKSLEHYVAAKVLELSEKDVYIDVASCRSPVPEIYQDLFGCKVYRQDLVYLPGLHGNIIGGDACDMPVPDGFASKMALHCSFEHFEGDADSRFMKEASRVLAVNGKLCILPLYLTDKFGILTNPVVASKGTRFDKDALLYCSKKHPESHSRFYDVPHFISRVVSQSDLALTVYVVSNELEVDSACYLRFAALFEKA